MKTISKEEKEKLLNMMKEKAGDEGAEMANALLAMGEDMGFGLMIMGLCINLDATKEDVHIITHVFEWLKRENKLAYEMLVRTFVEMFQRKSEAIVDKFMNEQKNKSDGESN